MSPRRECLDNYKKFEVKPIDISNIFKHAIEENIGVDYDKMHLNFYVCLCLDDKYIERGYIEGKLLSIGDFIYDYVTLEMPSIYMYKDDVLVGKWYAGNYIFFTSFGNLCNMLNDLGYNFFPRTFEELVQSILDVSIPNSIKSNSINQVDIQNWEFTVELDFVKDKNNEEQISEKQIPKKKRLLPFVRQRKRIK